MESCALLADNPCHRVCVHCLMISKLPSNQTWFPRPAKTSSVILRSRSIQLFSFFTFRDEKSTSSVYIPITNPLTDKLIWFLLLRFAFYHLNPSFPTIFDSQNSGAVVNSTKFSNDILLHMGIPTRLEIAKQSLGDIPFSCVSVSPWGILSLLTMGFSMSFCLL